MTVAVASRFRMVLLRDYAFGELRPFPIRKRVPSCHLRKQDQLDAKEPNRIDYQRQAAETAKAVLFVAKICELGDQSN